MDSTAQNNQRDTQQDSSKNLNDKPIIGSAQYEPNYSSPNKEIGTSKISEIVKPAEPEIKIEEELKNVGIVDSGEKLKLDEIHKNAGIIPASESTPVNITPSNKIILPMTEGEADEVLKTKQSKFNLQENVGEFAGDYTEDSLPFFAALIKKVFKEMHRRVFGKKA